MFVNLAKKLESKTSHFIVRNSTIELHNLTLRIIQVCTRDPTPGLREQAIKDLYCFAMEVVNYFV